jgi:hypothetical protein
MFTVMIISLFGCHTSNIGSDKKENIYIVSYMVRDRVQPLEYLQKRSMIIVAFRISQHSGQYSNLNVSGELYHNGQLLSKDEDEAKRLKSLKKEWWIYPNNALNSKNLAYTRYVFGFGAWSPELFEKKRKQIVEWAMQLQQKPKKVGGSLRSRQLRCRLEDRCAQGKRLTNRYTLTAKEKRTASLEAKGKGLSAKAWGLS